MLGEKSWLLPIVCRPQASTVCEILSVFLTLSILVLFHVENAKILKNFASIDPQIISVGSENLFGTTVGFQVKLLD